MTRLPLILAPLIGCTPAPEPEPLPPVETWSGLWRSRVEYHTDEAGIVPGFSVRLALQHARRGRSAWADAAPRN